MTFDLSSLVKMSVPRSSDTNKNPGLAHFAQKNGPVQDVCQHKIKFNIHKTFFVGKVLLQLLIHLFQTLSLRLIVLQLKFEHLLTLLSLYKFFFVFIHAIRLLFVINLSSNRTRNAFFIKFLKIFLSYATEGRVIDGTFTTSKMI